MINPNMTENEFTAGTGLDLSVVVLMKN